MDSIVSLKNVIVNNSRAVTFPLKDTIVQAFSVPEVRLDCLCLQNMKEKSE